MHDMKLVDFAFNAIKNGQKDIEVRLNDEKRRLIKVGDKIVFHHIDTGETIEVTVINIHKFNSFKELFDTFDHHRIGVKEDDDASIMDNFYSQEEQEKYGAIGIEIKLN